jgi:predicted acyltransferase
MEMGDDRRRLLMHTIRRAALIFLVGLLLNGFPYYNLSTLRIPGVLQRIAICYLAAAALFLYTGLRTQIATVAALLIGYWMAMTLIPVPGYGPGELQPIGNLSGYIDSVFLSGHMYSRTKVWDPEGILSTLPAIATTSLGILSGRLVRSKAAPADKNAWLLSSGNVLLLMGLLLDPFFPINKPIWTSSYVLLMAGLAAIVFGITYWLVDVHGWRRGARPFVVFGMNAMAVYIFAGALSRIMGLSGWHAAIYPAVFAPLASPRNASLLYACAFVLVCYAFCEFLYRRRWFLKF